MTSITLNYESCLLEIAGQRDDVVVLTAENRAALRNAPSALGPRFLDFGICEQTMVGAAGGLALRGRIPVVHALAAFLTMRAFEFIRTDIGIPGLPVKLVGAVPGFLSEANGPTHQSLEDIHLMRGIPSMRIFCPADIVELCEALPDIIDDPAPWYIRYCTNQPATAHVEPFAIGHAERSGQHLDAVFLTYGFLLREVLHAQELLASRGIRTTVLNLRTLAPIDREAILDVACRASHLITVEDHFLVGGLRTLVSEILLDAGFTVPVTSLALHNRWFTPGLLPNVLDNEGFSGRRIAGQIHNHILRRHQWQTHQDWIRATRQSPSQTTSTAALFP